MKTRLFTALLAATGTRAFFARLAPWSGVLVLNYHRIGTAAGSPFDHGLWSADEDAFESQMKFLKTQADIIVPEDLPAALARKQGRYALVTFDDGYADNFTAAYPILKRHGLRATFFITTGFLDAPHLPWWDEIAWMVRTSFRDRIDVQPWLPNPVVFDDPVREQSIRCLLRAYKAMPTESTGDFLDAVAVATGTGRFDQRVAKNLWMTWANLREMRDGGMSIGGHTVSHPVLSCMSCDQQWDELDGCRRRLAEELKRPMLSFSYPVGGRNCFNEDTKQHLQKAGVQFAFSYYGGYCQFNDWDQFDFPRVAIESHITRSWFRSIVSLPRFFATPR